MEITVFNRQRGHVVDRRGLERFLRRLAREIPARRADAFGVSLVSDRRMREYNRRFRGEDCATDVLSFPAHTPSGPPGERQLGDIVVSVETAARQARRRRRALERELETLCVHGYLHLLGFDHEAREDRGEMLRLQRLLERRLRSRRSANRAGGG